MTDAFNWNDLDEDAVVVRPTLETAAYLNTSGDVVIRQRSDGYGHEDQCVVIPLTRACALIQRLEQMIIE